MTGRLPSICIASACLAAGLATDAADVQTSLTSGPKSLFEQATTSIRSALNGTMVMMLRGQTRRTHAAADALVVVDRGQAVDRCEWRRRDRPDAVAEPEAAVGAALHAGDQVGRRAGCSPR